MSSKTVQLDPRVQRTRQLLEDSFLELLGQHAFQSITIQQIVARAGINRVTFYDHYEDKYDLYRQLVRKIFTQILADHLPASAALDSAYLRGLIRSVCVFFQQLNTTCPPTDRQSRPLVEVQVQTQLYQLLLAWLHAQQAAGLHLPASVDLTAKMMSWAIFGACLEWEPHSASRSVDALAAELFAVVACIVSAPPLR